MIREWLDKNNLENCTLNIDFIPKICDRYKWENLPENVKQGIISTADSIKDFEFLSIPATDALMFTRNGNRDIYEGKSFQKRNNLALLVLGECVINDGRYLDSIINGIWSICEESFWGIPAHMDGMLPDINKPVIDLFSAQTANLLAMTSIILGDKLSAVTPVITDRIDYELNKRIVTPFYERTDFFWMGYSDRKINNWTPWILSNILIVFVRDYCNDKSDISLDCIRKAMWCIDSFINAHSVEGSCDEGCSYWGYGALSLFDFLELLFMSSNGAISFFDDEKIKNIFTFITKIYIGKNAFVNFADASPYPHLDLITIYRMGVRIDDDSVKSLARTVYDFKTQLNNPEYITLRRHIFDVFAFENFINYKPYSYDNSFFYLSDIQLVAARKGDMFVAYKGGNNDENHNHNDVGSFVIYKNSKPVFIDIGAGVYTSKTFSADRYSIFTMQSSYHNLPDINSHPQKEGKEAFAEDFTVESKDGVITTSMKLDRCYQGESFERSFKLSNNDFVITDTFQNAYVSMNFILADRPEFTSDGFVSNGLKLSCNKSFEFVIEDIELTDKRLNANWGSKIYRLILTFRNADQITYTIS